MTRQSGTLFRRQKLLLTLLQAFGGRLSNPDLNNLLFLLTRTCNLGRSYAFVPYKWGGYSFQACADRRRLEAIGAVLDVDDSWQLAPGWDNSEFPIDPSDRQLIFSFAEQYHHLKGDDLIRFVGRNHPYYAINCERASVLMSAEERAKINQARPSNDEYRLFTIGYEGKSIDDYLNRLIRSNVRTLCDVRKNPISRSYGFSKSTLSDLSGKLNIQYVHIPELGIASDQRKTLRTEQDRERLFDEYEKTTLKQNVASVTRLHQIFLRSRRVAMTCFEADSRLCHRGRVATDLAQRPDWCYETENL